MGVDTYGNGKDNNCMWSPAENHLTATDEALLFKSQITFAYVYIYAWSVTVIKLSIIFYYYRIFGMTWASWFAVFLTCTYWLINHIVLPLYCKPLHYYWTQWSDIDGGHCPVNEANFYLGIGIMNMIGDIVILIIPIPVVWKLQMRRPQKIGVVLIFLLGSL